MEDNMTTMTAASKKSTTKTYIAQGTILHSKKTFRKDAPIELTEAEAAPLLKIGSIRKEK